MIRPKKGLGRLGLDGAVGKSQFRQVRVLGFGPCRRFKPLSETTDFHFRPSATGAGRIFRKVRPIGRELAYIATKNINKNIYIYIHTHLHTAMKSNKQKLHIYIYIYTRINYMYTQAHTCTATWRIMGLGS